MLGAAGVRRASVSEQAGACDFSVCAAGGAGDIIARAYGQKFTEKFGQLGARQPRRRGLDHRDGLAASRSRTATRCFREISRSR